MEKNKQVLEFETIIQQVDKTSYSYEITRSMFLDYIDFVGMPWDDYINLKTKKEILDDYKYFNQYLYLPF